MRDMSEWQQSSKECIKKDRCTVHHGFKQSGSRKEDVSRHSDEIECMRLIYFVSLVVVTMFCTTGRKSL